ncbi:hypothetical protein Mycsm_06540 (plasmid) [Mycobacterium sp. JS623]|uniref:DUF7373 family lipoprotein n=1 Tax=Mycobacterium sp. JS623 TaxID=212767 RepID=UPI0002A5587F|nr:hypothetical protein [Mycobacterium sp. JS623]AGB26677.1 hypothetical protein Mycsm_06540 [Mycobacterium sp. JS623]
MRSVRDTPTRNRSAQLLTAPAALAATAMLLASCSTAITGEAVKAADGPPPGQIDVALLDVGNYPTKPRPLGTAGTPELGAIAEGQRMANYVTGPWEVDPTLIRGYANSALVIKNAGAVKFVLPESLAAPAARHNFITGYYTAREDTDHQELDNAVLRFADPASAADAAKEISDAAAVEPVVNPPVTPVPIPGHPDTAGFSQMFTESAKKLQWTQVRAFTAHGPFVLVMSAQATDNLDTAVRLIATALDLQVPLIDQFTPTDPAQLAELPIDPTGLLARTVPISPAAASVNQLAVYQRRGSLQLQTDPTRSSKLFNDTDMNQMANAATSVYEARDAQAAQRITDGFFAEASATGMPAAPVKQMPSSRCLDISQGKVASFYCLATADRYAIEAQAAQLHDAQQKTAAQYALLMAR